MCKHDYTYFKTKRNQTVKKLFHEDKEVSRLIRNASTNILKYSFEINFSDCVKQLTA